MNQAITACAFIHKDEKLFIAKRADTTSFLPGLYELPGGHIEYGEDIIEGLRREIREEFGKDICVGDPYEVFTYINGRKGMHYIEVIYFATFVNDSEPILDLEEHSAYAWVTKEELTKIFPDKDREKLLQ